MGKKYERGTTDTGVRTEVREELRTISGSLYVLILFFSCDVY